MEENSEKKPAPQAASQNPPGTTSITVRNPLGKDGVQTYREVLKDKDGKFIKKARPPIPVIDFVRAGRKRLAQIRKDQKTFNDVTEDMSIVEELLAIIHTPIEYDQKTGLPDSKFAGVKVQAADTLWLHFKGKPSTSEQDLEALKHDGIKVVIVQPPDLMHSEITEEKKEEKKVPSFANVLDVKTNPQT